jgi:hypothetical protein
MTKPVHETLVNLSYQALSNFELDSDPLRWLGEYMSLYQSIC